MIKTKPQLIDVNSLSKFLCVRPGTVYCWVYQRRIPYLKVGSRVLFDMRAIRRWILARTNPERSLRKRRVLERPALSLRRRRRQERLDRKPMQPGDIGKLSGDE